MSLVEWLIWFAALFFLLGVVFPLVAWSLSYYSGWRRLAERYPLTGVFPEQAHRFQSLTLNGVRYRRVLRMAERPEGLYLVPMGVFSFNHPPLFFPWHELQIEEQLTWWGWYSGRFRSMPQEAFHIPASVKARWTPYLRRAVSTSLEPEVS